MILVQQKLNEIFIEKSIEKSLTALELDISYVELIIIKFNRCYLDST